METYKKYSWPVLSRLLDVSPIFDPVKKDVILVLIFTLWRGGSIRYEMLRKTVVSNMATVMGPMAPSLFTFVIAQSPLG